MAGIICAVACFHYYRMSTIYVESLANAITIAEDGSVSIGELAAFPTAYRYIDWLITVPLMVLEFPPLSRSVVEPTACSTPRWHFACHVDSAWIAEVSPISSSMVGFTPSPALLGRHGQHAVWPSHQGCIAPAR